jgi:quercetin dioxygenase-like cupin family protein
MTKENYVRSRATTPPSPTDWGQLVWLIGQAETPGAQQTFGVVTITPGHRNPLHSHPNCEELLYVVSGECDHRLGDEMICLKPGDVIRIPQGVRHWAKCTSKEPLTAVISFSSADRQTDNHEGTDEA